MSLMVLVQALAQRLCGHGDLVKKAAELQAELVRLQTLATPPSSPFPESVDTIDWQTINGLFNSLFPDYKDRIFISDRQFLITSIDELRTFINWDNTNIFKYEPEYSDCDDFALALAGAFAKYPGWSGFPVTFVWANYGIGPHAFVLAVAWPSQADRTPTLYYIEPQNDYELAPELMEGMELLLLPI